MTDRTQIESLKQRHAALDRAIVEESERPLPDHISLQELKRQKLQLKDEISHRADS